MIGYETCKPAGGLKPCIQFLEKIDSEGRSLEKDKQMEAEAGRESQKRTPATGPTGAESFEDDESSDCEQEQQERNPPEFFDPDLDNKDEEWVQQQRQGRVSDATLSCPGCLTTCCIDCQQHDYKDQYRAMFVTNCRVDFEETVLIGGQAEGSRKRQREGHSSQKTAPGEVFHPFYCLLCNTKLGLYDSDEVFHFVGVIASEP